MVVDQIHFVILLPECRGTDGENSFVLFTLGLFNGFELCQIIDKSRDIRIGNMQRGTDIADADRTVGVLELTNDVDYVNMSGFHSLGKFGHQFHDPPCFIACSQQFTCTFCFHMFLPPSV